jgi:hypothetical protein
MSLLKLTLAYGHGGRLQASEIEFQRRSFRLNPADHILLKNAGNGLTALTILCAEQLLWEKQRLPEFSRPFAKGSSWGKILHGANSDKPEESKWVCEIFGRPPKDVYLTNHGSKGKESHHAKFSDDLLVEVIFNGRPASEEKLREFLLAIDAPGEEFLPPKLRVLYRDGRTELLDEMSVEKLNRALTIKAGDKVAVSFETAVVDRVSLLWIDSNSKILVLASPHLESDLPFRIAKKQNPLSAECVIEPLIGFDEAVGAEMLIAIVHKARPSQAGIRELKDLLSSYSRSLGLLPSATLFSHNYLHGKKRLRIGAHALVEEDLHQDALIQAMEPWATSFQCILIPHI